MAVYKIQRDQYIPNRYNVWIKCSWFRGWQLFCPSTTFASIESARKWITECEAEQEKLKPVYMYTGKDNTGDCMW
jgi:hypothetical protein